MARTGPYILALVVCAIQLTDERILRTRRNEHYPPSFVRTFLRDSVEQVPDKDAYIDRSGYHPEGQEFGSRSLPLRVAVEKVPNFVETSKRLPLRDAVEKRLPPDEAFDSDIDFDADILKNVHVHGNHLGNSLQFFQGVQYQPSTFLKTQQFVTVNNPFLRFQTIAGGLGHPEPYRSNNFYQQLLVSPRGRSLRYQSNPFLQNKEGKFLEGNDKKVVCYYESEASHRQEPLAFNPEDIDPFACTHLIYAFATIDPHSFELIPRDEDYDIIHGGYTAFTGLKHKNPDLKVLLSVGGNRVDNTNRFSSAISSSAKRRNFINSVITILRRYNFDGLDLHFQYLGAEEFGGKPMDKLNLELLLDELHEVFKPNSWLLTVALPGSRFRIEDGFNPTSLQSFVDFVILEAYDFHKEKPPLADHHSPLRPRPHDVDINIFYNTDYAVKYLLKKGFPSSKLILGVPFYGRSFTLQYSNSSDVGSSIMGPGKEGFYTHTSGMLAYFEICDKILNEGWTKHVDEAGSPYIVNGDQWVGFDDVDSLTKKMNYVKELNLAGASVWAIDLDDFKGLCYEKWPLLNVVRKHLRKREQQINKFKQPVATKPVGTCASDGLFSDPKACASYYICRNGLTYHLSCGGEMTFDPETGKCGYYDGDQCKPGESIHITNARGEIDNLLRHQKLVDDRKKVVCYFTSWAFYRKGEGKFVPEHIDTRLCTHIVYAFASLEPESLILKEFDPWADLENNLYQRVTSINDAQVMLSLGGWTDSAGDKYSRLVSDGSLRRKFVIGTVSFLRRHNFKGLHLDWNYPVCWQSNCKKGPASDKPNFTKLVQELRREFDKESPALLLAASISGYKEVIDASYELAALGRELDFISVMTYDYHGAWEGRTGHVSPLFQRAGDKYPQYNTNFTMEYLVSRGAPREKLLVGIPFYGQSFTLLQRDGKYDDGVPIKGPGEPGEYTKQPGMLAFNEICNKVRNQRWMLGHDPQRASGPHAYSRDQWVGFDDVEFVLEKARYIQSSGFGGAVAWTIDLDDFTNRCCQGTYPLLKSLNRGLGLLSDNGPVVGDCTKPQEPVTPPPPTLTTGVDSGASEPTEPSWGGDHEHHHHHTTSKRPSTTVPWWSTEQTTTTSSPWWSTTTRKPTTTLWWVPTTPSTRRPTTTTTRSTTTTTRRTTTPWYAEPTTRPPPGVIMPEPQPQPGGEDCEPGQYLPDSRNCNAYYRCILGEKKRNYCAAGLHWNKEKNVCDWPDNAKCEARKQNVPTSTTTRKPTTRYQRPTTNVYMTKTTTRYTYTTPKPTTVNLENCENGQYYPHEECNSFYVCVNGQLVTQQCAPGLQWNVDAGMCDWVYKVKCLGRRKIGEPFQKVVRNEHMPYSPCSSGSFSAYSGDCTQYLICLWGKYEPFQCAAGLHWNDERQICDWPLNARCEPNEIGGGGEVEVVSPHPEETTENRWTTTTRRTTTTPTTPEPPSEPLPPHSGYFKIVCYFTNWAWYRKGIGKYVPEDIDGNLCTHVVYGFAVLDYENLVVKAHDSWADYDNKFYERVVAYKKKGIKVSLALGGWNDSQGDKYSRLANNPAARARFIKHVLEFLEKYDFDGLDLDWEYPKCWQVDCKKGPDSDKQAFAAWVKELKEAFRPRGYLLSAAVSPSKTVIDAGYDVASIGRDLDWVAVMTYDFHGQWDKKTGHVAPLYYHPEDEVAFFNANYSIHYWISEGVPRRKIVMGMPLYGQSFQLENAANNGLNQNAPGPGQAGEYTRAAGFLAYYEICDNVKNKGWTVVEDPERRMGPYAYKGNQWVSFDNREMIQLKSEYIRKMDLGGGMIWALDLDDFKNRCGEGRHPLLTTIRKVLAAPGTGRPETFSTPAPDRRTPVPSGFETTTQMATSTESLVDPNSEYKVVCYFTNWAWYRQGHGKYLPSDIDPDLCTHIVYGFAVLNGDQLVIKPHDSWADFDNKFYEKVTAFKKKGIKVLIAIGGWNDSAGDKYSKLVNNPTARRRFITHVEDFVLQNNFDGLDLDWEYPKCWQVDCNKGPASDKEAFADFVRELSESFKPKGLLLSSAVSPSKRVIDAGYDVPTLSRYLDWIAVMCYDYHGQWDKITGHVAPMYAHPEDIDVTFNSNFTIHYWIEQGADRKKLVMGMPMYGQSFSLADNEDNGLNAATYGGGEAGDQTRARGFLSYYEICANIRNKGWTVVRDEKGRIGPYAYLRDQWVSFDDIDMIRHKSEYIKAMGLGGGMIWALDLDDFKNECQCENYPLLRTINRVLRNYAVPAPRCELGSPTSPTTKRPRPSTTTTKIPSWQRPQTKPPVVIETTRPPFSEHRPCDGRLFVPDQENCNRYYLCNQGQLQMQHCPSGLYWNVDHCDWPENTKCHPDGTTVAPETTPNYEIIEETELPTVESSIRPTEASTSFRPIDDSGYKVVCYFTNWAWYRQGDGKYTPSDIDVDLCTHITYGFAVLDGNSLKIKPHDSWADIDNDFYRKVVEYKSRGIRVLIAIGGWNDSLGDKYSRLVNNPSARARFVEHVIEFIEKWGFDGLDLDWEYPKCWQVDCNKGPDSDKAGFASLVRELSNAFRPKGLLLSSAVSPSKAVIDAGYDVPVLSRYFDWIAVMTYDFHGHWDKQTGHVAPLYYYPGDTYDYFNANFSLHYWIEKGAHPKKLVMGMPLYGQSFSLADGSTHGLNSKSYGPGEAGEFTRAGGFLAFYEICERVKRRGWNVVRDPLGRIGPYAHSGSQWVSYDDIAEIKRKSQLIKDLDLGGGMIWALDLDDFRNRCGCGKHPLLRTMNHELRSVPLEMRLENCT